jgi:hypothetical protein
MKNSKMYQDGLKTAGLLFAGLLMCITVWAQPGGQAGAGGNDEGQKQQEKENECLRLLEKTRAPETHHFQQPHRPLVLIGEEGTELLIPADAFVHADGTPVTGEVEIKLTEVANKQELILSNLPTQSNGRMLVSGGVIHIEALADGKQLKLADGKSVLVNFPGGYIPDMQLFKGQYDAAGTMNWVPMAEAPGSKAHPMAKTDMAKDLSMPLFLDYGKVNPNTFQFADGEHSVVGYMNAMMQTGYRCVGNDRVYLEMKTDETGRVTSAKTLTGKNPCYRLAIEEVAQTLQFDLSLLEGKREGLYVEVNPMVPVQNKEGENMFASLAGNADAFNNPQVLAAIEEYMEKEKAQNFAKNAFAVTDLGWINCDRFYNEPGERVNVMASVSNKDLEGKAKAYLVFESMNAVIEGQMSANGQFTFVNIPTGMKAKIVALGYNTGDGAYLSQVNVTTKAGNVASLSLNKISENDLKSAMASL